MTAIGFVGLGRMGQPMAARLIAAGHALTVLDISAEATARFLAGNVATKAPRGRALAEASDVIITMLPTSAIVAYVFSGADGVLAGLKPGALVV